MRWMCYLLLQLLFIWLICQECPAAALLNNRLNKVPSHGPELDFYKAVAVQSNVSDVIPMSNTFLYTAEKKKPLTQVSFIVPDWNECFGSGVVFTSKTCYCCWFTEELCPSQVVQIEDNVLSLLPDSMIKWCSGFKFLMQFHPIMLPLKSPNSAEVLSGIKCYVIIVISKSQNMQTGITLLP